MVSSNNQQLEFNSLDIISGVCLVGGSIASIFTQKIALAVIPLSLAVGLEILNRQQKLVKIHKEIKTELVKNDSLLEETLKIQQEKLTQIEEKTANQIELSQQKQQESINSIILQLEEVKKSLSELSLKTEKINLEQEQNLEVINKINKIEQEQNLEEVINKINKIEAILPKKGYPTGSAQFYYERGTGYQQLNDSSQAIEDYTQAISLNPEYVEAYYSRGILQAKLNNPKSAIEDLRQAAKLYFNQNNLDGYRQARQLCKELYNLRPVPNDTHNNSNSTIGVHQLFTLE